MGNDFRIDLGNGMYLAHRSHKYTRREWQGKGWRYWYGTEYKKDAEKYRKFSEWHKDSANTLRESTGGRGTNKQRFERLQKLPNMIDKNMNESNYIGILRGQADVESKKSAEYARTAYNSQKLYEKSLAYKVEKGKEAVSKSLKKSTKVLSNAVTNGKNAVSKLFKSAKQKVNQAAINTAKKFGAKTNNVETRTDISTGQKYRRVNGGKWEKVK